MGRLISRCGCLPYNPELRARARDLRNNMTKAEKQIWYNFLSNHRLVFHRQKIINHYIVDFYCSEARLVIEIDGESHFTKDGVEYDKQREAVMLGYGLKTLRFTNSEVLEKIDFVVESIEHYLKENFSNLQ